MSVSTHYSSAEQLCLGWHRASSVSSGNLGGWLADLVLLADLSGAGSRSALQGQNRRTKLLEMQISLPSNSPVSRSSVNGLVKSALSNNYDHHVIWM